MDKLKIWNQHPTWEEAEQAWNKGARQAENAKKNKGLSVLPDIPGITPETKRFLKWKSFKWMLSQDKEKKVLRRFWKRPVSYAWNYLKSVFKKTNHLRLNKDLFLYGLETKEHFEDLLRNSGHILVLGFSYCHKPFECPSGRFTADCVHDSNNPICRQCFIGKAVHALPEHNAIPLFIPTIHYIGAELLDILHDNPGREVAFIITACEMTLEMFGDWGNMVGIRGAGVRLDGRICNTMRAFELSEKGIKPGLTVVLDDSQRQILDWLKIRRNAVSK